MPWQSCSSCFPLTNPNADSRPWGARIARTPGPGRPSGQAPRRGSWPSRRCKNLPPRRLVRPRRLRLAPQLGRVKTGSVLARERGQAHLAVSLRETVRRAEILPFSWGAGGGPQIGPLRAVDAFGCLKAFRLPLVACLWI